MITSVLIDSKEPPNIQALRFNGIPVMVTSLEVGDLWATTDTNHILIIERKTPNDLLNSLRNDRLFNQVAAMVEKREDSTFYPYLVITGHISYNMQGTAITPLGVTGWNYNAVMGGLLTVQEMGVPVLFSPDDYEDCVIRLGKRSREEAVIKPLRPSKHLGDGAAVLLSLPGIGPEMLNRIWEESNGCVALALTILSDLNIESSVPKATRIRIRKALGLTEFQSLGYGYTDDGEMCRMTTTEVENV
jgi:ERCC4-type nuclease